MTVEPFDPRTASRRDLQAVHDLNQALRRESSPELPEEPLELSLGWMLNRPSHQVCHEWFIRDPAGDGNLAQGGVYWEDVPENRHACYFRIEVRPDARRRGLGSRILWEVAPVARAAGRTLLFTGCRRSCADAVGFLHRISAARVHVEFCNQLRLEDVDLDRMRAWREDPRAAAFLVGSWGMPYPEAELVEVAAMKEAQNLMPRGEMRIEDSHVTPEMLHEKDRARMRRGEGRTTFYARDPDTGRIAGYTEVHWHPLYPGLLHQGDTAVFPEFQGRRLGRRLKGALHLWIAENLPQAVWIRTWNATVNSPMLKINTELGYRPRDEGVEWQVELDTVQSYLDGRTRTRDEAEALRPCPDAATPAANG